MRSAGLYSDSIRFAAWDLILGEMELGQTEGIIGGVLRWPWIEIEVFIRQLALTRSKEWYVRNYLKYSIDSKQIFKGLLSWLHSGATVAQL